MNNTGTMSIVMNHECFKRYTAQEIQRGQWFINGTRKGSPSTLYYKEEKYGEIVKFDNYTNTPCIESTPEHSYSNTTRDYILVFVDMKFDVRYLLETKKNES